jgi:hypothetical protein
MSAAVPLVQDDRFWLDNSSCQLVRGDLEAFLDARAVASEYEEDPEPVSSLNVRGVRRRTMRLRNRGNRPTDPNDAKTSPWFKPSPKEAPKHRRYRRTVIFVSHTGDGKLVMDVHRAVPKPVPNRRKDAALMTDPDRRAVDPLTTLVDAATTEVSDVDELVEGEVILEGGVAAQAPLARVILPHEAISSGEDPGEPDQDILTMVFGDEVPDGWDCCALPECIPPTRNRMLDNMLAE